MIKNDRQYQITRAEIRKFEDALSNLTSDKGAELGDDALFRQIQADALQSQLADLRAEVEEYEAIKSGKRPVLVLDSFDQFPHALIAARIAAGMSQRDLANSLGIKEQQVQRYEATEYASASVHRVGEVIRALDLGVREEVLLPTAEATPRTLFKRLRDIGIDKNLVLQKLLPPGVRSQLETGEGEGSDGTARLALQAASTVGRIFGLTPAEVFGEGRLQLNAASVGITRFKVASGVNERRLIAYTVYAHYLAGLLLHATPNLEPRSIPTDPKEFRAAIINSFGFLDFEHLLRYVWDLGIAVLPLNDPGAFHGACWRINGRNVIVLKQRTLSTSRWMADLVHEARHVGEAPAEDQLAFIEECETFKARKVSPTEKAAIRFVGDVLLDGRAEELAHLCVKEAGRSVERLKAVVPRVAAREGVDVGVLADYLAFRLGLEQPPINWWGAATNLQPTGGEPWRIARDALLERVDLRQLEPFDRELLTRALTDPEE